MSFTEIIGRAISAGIATAIFFYVTKTYQVQITDFEYYLFYHLTLITNILMFSDLCGKKRGER